MSTTEYQRILREAKHLPPDDQRKLIEQLEARLRARQETGKKRPRWEDLAGTAPYPLCGEDAQQWVTRTRKEADDRRKVR